MENHHRVSRLTGLLRGCRGVVNLHPAYASVLIDFDPRLVMYSDVEALVRARIPALAEESAAAPRSIEIPVRFDGPDLEDVARHTGLSPEGVAERFAAAGYIVYFVGFATCFPYLAGLPPELATPRLPAPRRLVPAGSVAIGAGQAGVYPLPSPGGWRIIGHTPLRLFDHQAAPPALLGMGDRVRFVPL